MKEVEILARIERALEDRVSYLHGLLGMSAEDNPYLRINMNTLDDLRRIIWLVKEEVKEK